MSALTAGHIEDARPDGKLEEVDQPGGVAAILLRGEKRLVLEQIVGVEVRRPPLRPSAQKNTGSR
jgi:hypothetical protein